MAVIRDREDSLFVQCSVVTALTWFILMTTICASIPFYGLLLFLKSTDCLCSCTSIQPKTFRVLALAFFDNCLTLNKLSQALLYHGLYPELDVLSSTQTN